MNNKKQIIRHFLLSVPFLFIWLFIANVVVVTYSEGIVSVIKDAFGAVCVYVLLIFAVAAFTSVIYLPIILKKEWKVQLIAYIMTFVFCICCCVGVIAGNSKFSEFSEEKWSEFPARRITMYEDLEKNYGLIGHERLEVEKILGEPDLIVENDIYFYDSTHGNGIYIEFENDKVSDSYFIE